MLVTFEELQNWSGYAQPSAVRAWLQRNSIPYVLNKDGQPVTTQGAIDGALLRQLSHESANDSTPNFDALKAA